MAVTPSSTSSQPTLPTLASRLVAIRQKLLARGTYLGHNSVRDTVKWQRIRRANQVVEVRAEPSVSTEEPSTSASAETSDAQKYPSPPVSVSDGPVIASLSAIVKISSNGYYLTSDGNYRPGGKVYRHLSDVRCSFLCEAPTIEPFKSDFERVLENIRWLQRETATPGFTSIAGIFPTIPNCFKVRHVLFEKKLDSAVGDDEDEENDDPTWTIENWPVSAVAQDELDSMRDTYVVVPIPAYDMAGELIKPHLYRPRLEGALVELEFGLFHWSIGGKDTDSYVADLDRIWVIAPPTGATPSSPKKRRVPDSIDVDLSPTKRRS